MPLAVMYSKGGSSQAHPFKQTRPTKASDEPSSESLGEQRTSVHARPMVRSVIDSTGSGTAHITAALTIYMTKLGGTEASDNDADSLSTPDSAPDLPLSGSTAERGRNRTFSAAGPSSAQSGKTGSAAADLLRALDAYAS